MERNMRSITLLTLCLLFNPAWAGCSEYDIIIKSMDGRFVDQCAIKQCFHFEGEAVLSNDCANPVGIKIKITAYDEDGAVVASNTAWPAGTTNIPSGDYAFALSQWLPYNPEIKTFVLKPVDVEHWREQDL